MESRDKGQSCMRRLPKPLKIESAAASMALKVYEEQCYDGFENVIEKIKTIDQRFLVAGIIHDDGMKPHLHILVKPKYSQDRFRVSTMLKELGIEIRLDVDDSVVRHRGLETIGDVSAYLTYMLHRTPNAFADNKKVYEIKDLVSNASEQQLKSILEVYETNRKQTQKELHINLLKHARQAGYNLSNYEDWARESIDIGMSTRRVKEIHENYVYGFKRRQEEAGIFARIGIKISPDNGCELNINMLLSKLKSTCHVMGLRCFSVCYKLRELEHMPSDTDVLIICPGIVDDIRFNKLDLLSHRIELLYGRAIWKGKYVFFLNDVAWVKNDQERWGVLNNCYLCSFVNDKLVFIKTTTIRAVNENERKEAYKQFRNAFNTSDFHYLEDDYSDMNS